MSIASPSMAAAGAVNAGTVNALERIAELRRLRRSTIDDFFGSVRDVVILASSSRGGSSLLAETLRHSDELLHFQAEINPFLYLAGLTHPASGTGSDRLPAEGRGDLTVLAAEMALDVGNWRGRLDDAEEFALNLAWRLSVQWPEEDFAPGEVIAWVEATLDELEREHGWRPGTFPDWQLFHLRFLHRVHLARPRVNPYYYDLEPGRVRQSFPHLEIPSGPPSNALIEEPPFMPCRPWRRARPEDLERPLIIKTPSNVYRLDFLRELFASARFRILHLTRNPASSINGLIDGWLFHGFHSHRLERPLAMAGYTDQRPHDAQWWKYDLPPGWRSRVEGPLAAVCGFQWVSSHRAVLEYLERENVESFRIRFEEVIGSPERRLRAFAQLMAWLGVAMGPVLERVVREGLPPIMATRRPRARRWLDRCDVVEPVVCDPEVRDIMERLCYVDRAEWT